MDNFCHRNCICAPNAYRLVAQKVFLFQILEETTTFTLPGKVPFWQKCQNDVLCGNMNADVSSYILKFRLFFKVLVLKRLLVVKSEMIYLLKKVCLIIIHRNPTHILDMPCCHKHQQQRYHNGNTKICIFIHNMPFQLSLNVLPEIIKP